MNANRAEETNMDMSESSVIKQHLIDPEICIRCNTCEAICPVDAITHDSRNYVVDAEKCNLCMACVPPCPTGSIDNWRNMPKVKAYSIEEQLTWDELPQDLGTQELQDAGITTDAIEAIVQAPVASDLVNAQAGSSVPPWSAAHAFTNLYGAKAPEHYIVATVTGNHRVTEVGQAGNSDYDTHHVVLDFGDTPFPVLEGQSIGILPPGVDQNDRPHHARQYSIASPRNGERPGYNNLSLTIKRVLEDHSGKPVRGVVSNYMCDLKVGDQVKVIGPFGASFLMPNHPKSSIVMICTGTGSAPMRGMTEWRRRLRQSGKFESGKLMLFFGARTQEELPYFGPLQNLPKDFIDINFAFSRAVNQPKKHVQDLMRERTADLAPLLADPHAYFYVCGLKSMEEGVLLALQDIVEKAGMNWEQTKQSLKQNGRLHLETY
jgi:benzoyl-CoA 2,3-dioxygenase component A